jgi:ATP-dependent RNA helicase RhlE
VPDDYIHRVGRTARAEMTGDAFTFVSPEEEQDLRAIERAIGKRLPRVIVPDFDYRAAPLEKLEVPIAERIAAIRARKAQERARAKEKAQRRAAHAAAAHPRKPKAPVFRDHAPRRHEVEQKSAPRWGRR